MASPQLTPTADNYISSAVGNQGTATLMQVGNLFFAQNVALRGLMRFDLSVIPSGAVLQSASLVLTRAGGGILPSATTFTLSRLTQPDWTELGSTWTAYATASNWATAGGDFTTTNQKSVSITSSDATVTFPDVLDLVRDGIEVSRDGTCEWILRGAEGTGDNRFIVLHSRQSATPAARPKLLLTYLVHACVQGSDHTEYAVVCADESAYGLTASDAARYTVTASDWSCA